MRCKDTIFRRKFAVQMKNFRRKIQHIKKPSSRENGFVVIGWISLLAGLCLPFGKSRRQ
jgi:hypothetical protein